MHTAIEENGRKSRKSPTFAETVSYSNCLTDVNDERRRRSRQKFLEIAHFLDIFKEVCQKYAQDLYKKATEIQNFRGIQTQNFRPLTITCMPICTRKLCIDRY